MEPKYVYSESTVEPLAIEVHIPRRTRKPKGDA